MKMWSPGKIMTGLLDKRGRRSWPELQRAAQARCSRLHTAAVREGLVSFGATAAMLILSDARNRWAWFSRCCLRSGSTFVAKKQGKAQICGGISHTRGDGAVTSQIPLSATALSLIDDSRVHSVQVIFQHLDRRTSGSNTIVVAHLGMQVCTSHELAHWTPLAVAKVLAKSSPNMFDLGDFRHYA